MTGSGIKKLGWHWTRKGWKRTPKHIQQVKKVPIPTKRRTRKKEGVASAPPRIKPPTFAEAREKAAERVRAISAPTPVPEAGKPTTRQLRRVWNGKYDDLAKPKPQGDA